MVLASDEDFEQVGGSRRGLRAEVKGLLECLGEDTDAVAATLRAAGVRGDRHQSRSCAVARYLGAVIGADRRVHELRVMKTDLLILGPRWWSARILVPLPAPVRGFISAFDGHRYPDLVARPPEVQSPAGQVEMT